MGTFRALPRSGYVGVAPVWKAVKAIVRKRDFIGLMIVDELRKPLEGSYLGLGWLVVKPVLFLIIYGGLFAVLFSVRAGSGAITGGYLLFLLAGLLPWYIFSDSLSAGAHSIQSNAAVVANFMFPVEIIPIVKVCAASVSGVIALALFSMIVSVQQLTGWAVFLVVLLLLWQLLFSIGLSLILSVLCVLVKDIGQGIPFVLILWMLVSPVGYGLESVPDWMASMARLNPVTYFLEAYRMVLLHGQVPPLHLWAVLAGLSSGAAFLGLWFSSSARRIIRDLV